MRQQMLDEHSNDSPLFDLKHDSGGIIDVEFMVQFLVLAHAHQHAALADNLGNIALLRLAGGLGLIPVALANAVADAYRTYRQRQHALRLQGETCAIVELPQDAVARVRELWRYLLGKR
jgi:glutamate-ammonia-ligase adenylyltransferase